MKSRLRKSILILVGAVGLFAGFYAYARPNWRLLTEVELRRTLKPELLATEPVDAAAQDRYRRFQRIAADWGYGQEPSHHATYQTRLRIQKHAPDVQALEKLVFEGPFQNPEREYVVRNFEPVFATKQLADCFINVAHDQVAHGDGPSAVRNYRTALGIAEQMSRMTTSWNGLGYQLKTYELIDQQFFDGDMRLSEKELGEIAKAIPPSSIDDPASRRVLLLESQMIFPALVDPIGWTRKTMPGERDPERILAQVASGSFLGPDSEAVLTYDARQTAAHLNHVLSIALANTKRSYRETERGLDAYGSRLTASYPANGAAGKSGAELWIKRMEYRWATARVRNGLGDRVVEMLCQGFETYPVEASFFLRALRESIRTRLALTRYRLRHGKVAPDLSALVKEGLIEKTPLDPYDGATLRYDPRRKLLWSVGENGTDERGRDKRHGERTEPDIVWKTL